ncbi:MAG: class GN sortase [Proteobacteria bacterium]|nr:class GN sortase [Pseudomonadota bacterium]
MRKTSIVVLLIFGLWHVSASGYMLAKSYLAQYLIEDAWQKTKLDGQKHRPWSWADTYPIFEIVVPRINKSSIVLQGDSGRNMAFSATHTGSSGLPGSKKTTVVSGHRDSHFEYLQHLEIGDKILANTKTKSYSYRIEKFEVVDSQKQQIQISNQDQLILTTCYPFDALQTGGSLRFVVYASRILNS